MPSVEPSHPGPSSALPRFRSSDTLNYMEKETTRIGKRGTLVIPARLRRLFGLEEGSDVLVEEAEGGILIRPAVTLAVERYPAERKAELLLNNAIDDEDYERAREEVERLGLDPDAIPHERP